MKDYTVFVYSKMRFSLMLLFFILSVIPITVILYKYNTLGQVLIGIYGVFVVIFPFFILPRYISKAILLISSDTEGFQFDWVKPYWGSKPKLTQRVRLDELKSGSVSV
jgi:hypothetical protein